MSKHVGIFPLRRLSKQPYHYSDKVKHVWLNDSDTTLHVPLKDDQVTKMQNAPVNDGNNTAMLAAEETEVKASSTEITDTCQYACPPRLTEQLNEVEFIPANNRKENAQITQEQKQS
jgi:hypothetical protein